MPVEDAIALMNRDFTSYRAGSSRSVPINASSTTDRHPDAVQVLLNMLADNRQLTVLQYDRIIKYLEVKREEQVQIELGDAKELAAVPTANDPKQAELQSRILNILNSSKPSLTVGPVPSPVPAPTPVPPTNWGAGKSSQCASTLDRVMFHIYTLQSIHLLIFSLCIGVITGVIIKEGYFDRKEMCKDARAFYRSISNLHNFSVISRIDE